MTFTNIRDLKYVTANNSHIDLYATCKEYGEIPMTLNLVDTEDLHTHIDEDGVETPLEEYCKTLKIAAYQPLQLSQEQQQAQANAEAIQTLNSTDWKVIRELERLMLAGTELNAEREALRASVI